LFPLVAIATAIVVWILAVRSLPGHEVECPTSTFKAKRAGEIGYGITWGPRANRQSIVIWGSGPTAEITFESFGPPSSSLEPRGPTRQISEFPPAAVAILLERLAGGDP
jgi:hypothetical protein